MKRNADLSIIIVSWNTKEVLRDCLESLFAIPTSVKYHTYVVDNNSVDGSPDMVEEDFPQVILIKNNENVGFAKANNQVLKEVKTPYALLLNSDTVLPSMDVFSPWLEFMEANPSVAASGCRLVFPDGSHQVGDAGYRPVLKNVMAHSFFLSRLFPNHFRGLFISSIPDPYKPMDVDWVCGADLMVRTSILEEVGLLDETIFMFAEDIEWCCRMRDRGYRVCYLPYLKIIHLQGVSTSKEKTKKGLSSLWVRNIKKVFKYYNPGAPIWVYNFFMGIGFTTRMFLYAVSGKKYNALKMFHYLKGLYFYE